MALIAVAGVILLVVIGFKNIQVGGLLSKLLGKKKGKSVVDIINQPPPDRVDEDGRIIPPGTPDSNGMTQAIVVPLEEPGIFDDQTQVKIIPPGTHKPVVVDLPDGVEAGDVDKIIVVKPDVVAISVKNDSPVSASDVDDLLKKYGRT